MRKENNLYIGEILSELSDDLGWVESKENLKIIKQARKDLNKVFSLYKENIIRKIKAEKYLKNSYLSTSTSNHSGKDMARMVNTKLERIISEIK